jgi:CubicO group peptidase (beta-lactamase class C family)
VINFGLGVGLAFGIVLEKDLKNGGTGSEGTISWGGYWNTSFFADPQDKYIGLIYKQTQNIEDNSSELFRRAVSTSVVK